MQALDLQQSGSVEAFLSYWDIRLDSKVRHDSEFRTLGPT